MRILSGVKTLQSSSLTTIFRKSTAPVLAAVMVIGFFASACRTWAVSMTWTNGNDVWTSPTAWTTNQATGFDVAGQTNVTCSPNPVTNVTATCVGGAGAFPGTGDEADFTNGLLAVTLNISTNVGILSVSNAAVTFNPGVSTLLNVTGTVHIGQACFPGPVTSTVYWAGGTLAVTNGGGANFSIGTDSNSVGQLYVTNGTVIFDQNIPSSSTHLGLTVGGVVSAGKLVVSGPGVVTNSLTPNNSSISIRGSATMTSQLIITNGGKLFVNGAVGTKSNAFVLVSDPGSLLSNSVNVGTSVITIGEGNFGAPGSKLVVSNGATLWSEGTISFGRGSSGNTGYVCGAGSKLVSDATGGFVIGITGGSNNVLVVYNGGYVQSGGIFYVPDGNPCPNNSLQMGGTGAMSTGLLVQVRQNTGSTLGSIIVTNAILTCSLMELQGGPSNSLSVLANGTLILSNQYAVTATTTNVLVSESINGPNTINLNGGTINAVSGSNAMQVVLGSSGETGPNIMIVTNGGRLLTEQAEIGANSSSQTGIVTGVGTVWSNYTAGVSYAGSNEIDVGVGSTAPGSYNYLAIQNGAVLVNNGDLLVGDSAGSTLNSLVLGGPGAVATIVNVGSITIGGNSASTGNTLTISNASISTGFVRVQATNTVVFSAGTLSAQGLNISPGANGSNEFVVGDGTDAAYYDMAPGGTGYHQFGSPGLVVTNGASLRGSGTLNGTTTILGTLVPGFANAVGSMFFSNSLSFGNAAVLNYDLGTMSDSVSVGGNLSLNGTLNINNAGGFGPGTYTLFTYAGSLTYSGLTIGSAPIGPTYAVSTSTVGQVNLIVTGSDPFTTWQNHYFTPAELANLSFSGPSADPLGKGMSNTNQFLAGFNPTNSAAYLHVISVAKTNSIDMNVIYLGANGDSSYSGGPSIRTNVLEFTTGTANGSYSNNFTQVPGQTNILSAANGLGTVTNMVDSGGATNKPSRYYRVRVLLP
ncbi:MAG TPA: hypothetical protein VMV72_10555 [Verrucomicrobiae bacterium]|nr:hypothetical protein [Verrucomicrobiae bacterium]